MLDVYVKVTQYRHRDNAEAEINRLRLPVNKDNAKKELTLSTSYSSRLTIHHSTLISSSSSLTLHSKFQNTMRKHKQHNFANLKM